MSTLSKPTTQPGIDEEGHYTQPTVCHRCQGLMTPESCFNLHYDAGEMEILTWRCLQCGELVDPVILQNRENGPPLVGRKKGGPMLPTVLTSSRKRTR